MVLFYLANKLAYVKYVMYGFLLAPDCTIHFINVLKYRASEASEEKNMYCHLNCQMGLA